MICNRKASVGLWRAVLERRLRKCELIGVRASQHTPHTSWSVAREMQIRGNPVGELNTRDTEHYSGYAIAEYDITDQLELSAEGRYSHEKFTYLFGRSISAPVSGTTLLRLLMRAACSTPPRPPTSSHRA